MGYKRFDIHNSKTNTINMQLSKYFAYISPKLLCLLSLTTFFSIKAFAQDPTFSQFYANRVYLNPAFAGIENGIALTATTRMQWLNVDRGFKTVNATAEMRLPSVGVGLGINVLQNQEGLSNLTSRQAGLIFSYTIAGPKNNFHFGLEGKLVQKSIDWNALVFSDQLDPYDGLVYPGAVQPVLDHVAYSDLDFGFLWRHQGSLKFGKTKLKDVRSHLGISFHHLPYLINSELQGYDSFLNHDFRVAPRTTIHGGMIIPVKIFTGTGKTIAVSPNFKLDVQGPGFMNFQQSMAVGTAGFFTIVDNYYLGLLYQNRTFLPTHLHTDAYILSIGMVANTNGRGKADNPNLMLGISVDLNTSGVGPAAGNVFEFNMRYRFKSNAGASLNFRNRFNPKNVLDCKRFF